MKENVLNEGARQVEEWVNYLYTETVGESSIPTFGNPIEIERNARLSNLRNTLSNSAGPLFEFAGKEQTEYLIHQYVNSPAFAPSQLNSVAASFLLFVQGRYYQFPRLASAASALALRLAVAHGDEQALASLPVLAVEDSNITIQIRASVVSEAGEVSGLSILESEIGDFKLCGELEETGALRLRVFK